MEFEFGMKFKLDSADSDGRKLVEQLAEAGCDDAVIGIGQPGRIALDFTREASSVRRAMVSALRDVKKAIRNAELIEVTPDFVGLTDIAELVGVSRQNMRKLMLGHPTSFPAPVHEGSASVWHLVHVLQWLANESGYCIRKELIDVASMAMQINLAKEAQGLEETVQKEVHALVA
jgi:hypothetical protein